MLSELKTVLRTLLRAPGYSLTVIVTLALGIGATAAFYSMFARALVPRTPYPDPDRLVRVEIVGTMQGDVRPPFMLRFLAYREATSFSAAVGSSFESVNLVLNGEPEGIRANRVTVDYFSMLGVVPALGRTFLPEEGKPGGDGVVVLSDWFWRNRMGADAEVLGKQLQLSTRSYRIIGVLSKDFVSPDGMPNGKSIYLPYVLPVGDPQILSYNPVVTLARLKPGISLAQAEAELKTIHPEAGTGYNYMTQFTAKISPISAPLDNIWMRPYRRMMWTGVAAVGFLCAIACVNAGSLMLVRTVGRRREIGIRLSLGGSRWDVIRPLLYESAVLSSGAIALGILIARWLPSALRAIIPNRENGWINELNFNGEVMALLAGLGVLTGLAVLVGPAWWTGRLNVNESMKEDSVATGESPRIRRLRGMLVMAEAALAVVLLTGAGLMARTFAHLRQISPGYEVAHRYVLQIAMDKDHFQNLDQMIGLRQRILDRLASEPGVSGVGMGRDTAARFYFPMPVKIVGRTDVEGQRGPEAQSIAVSTGFLETLGLTLRAGRGFGDQRQTDAPIVIINETMARRYFAGRNPLGERLEVVPGQKWEIVGVVADVRSFREEAKPRYYFPYWQQLQLGGEEVLLRTTGAPGVKFPTMIRRAINDVDPKLAVMSINSLEDERGWEVANEKAAMVILQVLSALALLMAVAGLFAMMAYSVAQRRGEFGVRLALGATPDSIYRLVLGSGVGLAATGVGIGLAVAWGAVRFLESMLIGVTAHDPLTYGGVGLLMLIVAVPACWLPARRATRVDLTKLLRSE